MALVGPLEILLILLIILLLFGPKRLPELAKALGESVKEFKKALQPEEKKPRRKAKKKQLSG
ncbi:twin-arginine translocase TatA/TatE family subunit [Candidatus Woesearchaeota archaeon]|nr:twin-arginine translocase TatA/TatE family subunit [Candidatus Woesearchaeota archaeon]